MNFLYSNFLTFLILLLVLGTTKLSATGHSNNNNNDDDDTCPRFHRRDLDGCFGLTITEVVALEGEEPYHAAIVGVVEFYRDGTCDSTFVINEAGYSSPPLEVTNCVFEVSRNGMGTVQFTIPPLGEGRPSMDVGFTIVIVDDANELRFISSSVSDDGFVGGVASGVAKRQKRMSCL